MIVSKRTIALIRLATDAGAALGEAQNAAMAACRQLVADGILGGDTSVLPPEEDIAEAPASWGHAHESGEVQTHDVDDFFSRADVAAQSAQRAAEAEDAKRRHRKR